jgi:hypothetical protein
MKRKRAKRERCNITGCVAWAYSDDCRCLKHIVMKYGGVWNRTLSNISDETGKRKVPVAVD